MIFAGMAVSSVSFGSNETRNNGGLQAFREEKALSVLQPWHRKSRTLRRLPWSIP
jgi:hypothetical protein